MSRVRFSKKEIQANRKFLEKVAANLFYFPTEECMRDFHAVVSMWAPELVIAKKGCVPTVLLKIYDGGIQEFKNLWHLPGGYNQLPETDIQTTCSRIALREIGADVEVIEILDAYKWKAGEHPYGRPLSVYTLCRPIGPIAENETLRFFGRQNLPANMTEPHRRFVQNYFKRI